MFNRSAAGIGCCRDSAAKSEMSFKRMNSTKLQNASHWAGLVAAGVAIATLVAGSIQFRKTLELQREAQAVELFVKYNETMGAAASANLNEYWKNNVGLAIAEAIFKLTTGDEGWRKTVSDMVKQHVEWLKKNPRDCATYDGDFVVLVRETAGSNWCQ